MFRVPLASVVAAAAAALATPVLASDARTTRIEPRPFYGATISLEAGVRVFRPLPPHDRVIINPGNRTPLNLTIKDVNEKRYIESHNTTVHKHEGGSGSTGGYIGGLPYYGYGYGYDYSYARGAKRGRGHHRPRGVRVGPSGRR